MGNLRAVLWVCYNIKTTSPRKAGIWRLKYLIVMFKMCNTKKEIFRDNQPLLGQKTVQADPALCIPGSWTAFKLVWNITPEVRTEMAAKKRVAKAEKAE